jgi:hypothetical protein
MLTSIRSSSRGAQHDDSGPPLKKIAIEEEAELGSQARAAGAAVFLESIVH